MNKPMQTVIEIPLKGTRPYIHSTDLWNGVAQKLGASFGTSGTLKVNIRALSKMSVELVAPQPKPTGKLIGDITHSASKTRLIMIEATQPSVGQLADHDAILENEIQLRDGAAVVPENISATPVEGVVAAYKILLTQMFPQIDKWLALCIDIPLDLLAPATSSLTVSHKSDVGGKTFFAHILNESDVKIGQLTFMGIDKQAYLDMEATL